jgi:hypothetical protein
VSSGQVGEQALGCCGRCRGLEEVSEHGSAMRAAPNESPMALGGDPTERVHRSPSPDLEEPDLTECRSRVVWL